MALNRDLTRLGPLLQGNGDFQDAVREARGNLTLFDRLRQGNRAIEAAIGFPKQITLPLGLVGLVALGVNDQVPPINTHVDVLLSESGQMCLHYEALIVLHEDIGRWKLRLER